MIPLHVLSHLPQTEKKTKNKTKQNHEKITLIISLRYRIPKMRRDGFDLIPFKPQDSLMAWN